jgi:hypothetical protein
VLVLGAALRVFQLPSQIIYEDELFPLRALLERSYSALFDRLAFGYTSIPQTALAKLVADTFGLDELSYRLPSLLAGLLLLGLVPGVAWRRFGALAGVVSGGLIAISPLLVFYSRFARPYAVAMLLVFLAVITFDRWLERGRARDALGYVAAATGAIWFHPLAATAVLAIPIAGAALGARSGPPGRRLAQAWPPLVVGGSVCALAGALLFRPLWLGWDVFTAKAGAGTIPLAAIADAAQHLAGTGSTPLAGVFWLGVGVGAIAMLKREPRLGWLLIASSLAPLAAVLVARPFLAQLHWILARYLIWALPCCLLFLALAIGELGRLRVRDRTWPLPVATAALIVAALFLSGPLPGAYSRPNNFAHHDDFLVTYWGERDTWGAQASAGLAFAARRTAKPEISPFYTQLRSESGEFAIVEGPWFGRWELTPFHHYQKVHGRRVVAGFVGVTPGVGPVALEDPRLAFRQLVDLRQPQHWRRPELRYVVLHRSVGAETGAPAPSFDPSPLLELYPRHFGPPVFEDSAIVVFDTRARP